MDVSPYLNFNGNCLEGSSGFGRTVDRFGIPWMVNSETPA
jgi:uncharacterized glyoxalase superfamily protein PhnB